MAKSVVKVKHLGLISTGKFIAVFCFIYMLVVLGIMAVVFGVFMLLSMLLGLGVGGKDALLGLVMAGGFSLATFAFMAVVMIILYPIIGFVAGVILAFVFNTVAKLSGGLSFDAEIDGK